MEAILNKEYWGYYKQLAPVVPMSWKAVPTSSLAKRIKEVMDSGHIVFGGLSESLVGRPEVEALSFYCLNHMVSTISISLSDYDKVGEKQEFMEDYHKHLHIMLQRMMYYVVLICTRESRHVRNSSSSKFFYYLREKYTPAHVDWFFQHISGKGSDGSYSAFLKTPPALNLGEYTSWMHDVFMGGDFHGGYGGHAWGDVAGVLKKYIHGTISAEMFLDTAFTLAHNNGPIFNKGMFFHTQNTQELLKILDVQRSGQIPEYFHTDTSSYLKEPKAKQIWELCRKYFKKDLMDLSGIDWQKVQDLGAVGNYSHMVKKKAPSDPPSPKLNVGDFEELEKKLMKESALAPIQVALKTTITPVEKFDE